MAQQFNAGDQVKCGICGRDTNVLFVTERIGGNSFDLACRHRNAICPSCGDLVRDDSDVLETVLPLCRRCNPEAFDDESDL